MVRTETAHAVRSKTGVESLVAGVASRDTVAGKRPREAVRLANVRVRLYVRAVCCAGAAVLALSAADMSVSSPPIQWWLLVALTLVSGSAVLKVPSVPVSFSISDVFTLTSAIMFGPAAGTVLVAFDSLVISSCLARTGLPAERILFNAAAPPVAMWLSARAFFAASGFDPLYQHAVSVDVVAPWLLAFAALYFCLNTVAIAAAIALHERVSVVGIWRAHFQNLWFTFIGGAIGAAFMVFALQHGRYGVILLAFPLLLAGILYFAYRNATGRMADQLQHFAQLNRLNLSTIEALAHAIDAKDGVTHDHIRRVQRQAIALAGRLGVDDEQQLRAIETAALLHDIGKLAIPEHILNKPGKLTPTEFERMKTHARVGAEILSEVDFPYPVVPIVKHHHENWDGGGYPEGLSGRDIPIGARILAVVDCYDALTSDRPYRRALSTCEALAIVSSRRGNMYEPAIVDAFLELCTSSSDWASDAPSPALDAEPRDLQAIHMPAPPDEMQLALHLGAALSRRSRTTAWQALAEALCEFADVDTAVVLVSAATSDTLVPAGAAGGHGHAMEGLTIPIGERMSGWAAATGKSMINADAALDLFDLPAPSLRSAVAIPYRSASSESIVVSLYSTRADAFTPAHQRVVEAALVMVGSRSVRTQSPRALHDAPGARRAMFHRPGFRPHLEEMRPCEATHQRSFSAPRRLQQRGRESVVL